MDDHSIRLVLGSPSQLPSSVEPLQVLLSTSFGTAGVLAAAELRARSDNLLSCKLQTSTVSDVEARSGLARALFIITDSIAYVSSAALSVHNSLAPLPRVSAVEGSPSDFNVATNRIFRCFNSAILDMSTQLGVHQYYPNYGTADGDLANFVASLSAFTPFPEMEPELGHWIFSGLGVNTDVTAYPMLMARFSTTVRLLSDQSRSVFQHVVETLTYDNRVWDRAQFEEAFPGLFERGAGYLRQAKLKVTESDPTFACNLPAMVTRFYTLACIMLTLRSGFVAIEALLAAGQFGQLAMVAVDIDPVPHIGGRYGAARESADRIIDSGPNGLAGSTNIWITHIEGNHSTPPVYDVDDVTLDDRNADSDIDPAIPANVTPPVTGLSTDDKRQKRKEGWIFLNNALKMPNSKFRLPEKSAPQLEWQDWKANLLQFDKQWFVETASSIQTILANVKNTDVRVHGWAEISNKAFRSGEPLDMAKFVDHVLRQVICTVTTRKTAWSQLQSLHKNLKNVTDCHVLSVKLQQLLADIFPSSTWTSDSEAAPCTHREIVLAVHQLTIAMKNTDKHTVIGKSWNLHDSYRYSDMFAKYVDMALHNDQLTSNELCSEYISMLVKSLDSAHREYSQLSLPDGQSHAPRVAAVQKQKSSRGRSHSVQAFDYKTHDADHNNRKRSAQPSWPAGNSSRGGRGSSRGGSTSRGGGRASSLGRTDTTSDAALDKACFTLGNELFTKIGSMFSKTDPDLLLPGIQNKAYPNAMKTLSQCRKDIGRGNCILCQSGRHDPPNCWLLRENKAHTEEGKMAKRFMAKWAK
jgi:uncharacterized membrane protein YgcG